eukprot:scaffold48223_cov31-Tisochrysis_lutea.AAC.1
MNTYYPRRMQTRGSGAPISAQGLRCRGRGIGSESGGSDGAQRPLVAARLRRVRPRGVRAERQA